MGALDANGIWQYTEDDDLSPFSDFMNLLADSTTDQVGLLQAAVAAIVAARDAAWSTYTPTLTAATTNPTLGTGSSASGRYKVQGKVCFVTANITFGSSGVSAGNGNYTFSLPVPPAAGVGATLYIGTAYLFDTSGSTELARGVRNTGILGRGTAVVNHAAPWTWAASDAISIVCAYEVA